MSLSTEEPQVDPSEGQVVPDAGQRGRPEPNVDTSASRDSAASWTQRLKYFLVKAAATTGMNFLTPLVLLAYGEEPARQCKEILRVIIAPVVAFGVFLWLWTIIAPMHKTKSGEVPTPAVVWKAAESIWGFHQREGEKESAYLVDSEQGEERRQAVQSRLSKVAAYEKAVRDVVAKRELEANAWALKQAEPLAQQIEEKTKQFEVAKQSREQSLAALANDADGLSQKETYLSVLREHLQQTELEEDQIDLLKDSRSEILSAQYPPLLEAKDKLNELAEERQHLTALQDQLKLNRDAKMEAEISRLKASQRRLLSAQSSTELADSARQVVLSEKRIRSVSESSYAKPWTLPMQIQRSVACAFCGFLIGALIAIPIGVLCGLSPTFMSAVTPFIALFKPVSPIVWLPIALIVVGGFIPDPDEHWFIQALADAPLIGWMKINPAFMASAISVALCSLWATLVNTALGVSSVDQDHLNVARVLRLGFWSRLFKIVIPSSLPLIFAGLRISLGVGWMVLIAGELLSSSEGIGKFVWDQFNNGASDSFAKMIVVVFVVGVIGLLLDRVMIVLQRLVSFDDAAAAL